MKIWSKFNFFDEVHHLLICIITLFSVERLFLLTNYLGYWAEYSVTADRHIQRLEDSKPKEHIL